MSESDAQLLLAVTRLATLLERIGHPRTAEVAGLAERLNDSPESARRQLNQNSWWAGASSLAAETMADNPGLSEATWMMEVREFRALLIEIGEQLLAGDNPNPGIGSWLLAFNHWNASRV